MIRSAMAFSLLAAFATLGSAAPDADTPNVVLIFTDDQGYQDVGCFGSPDIATPHLDRMAKEGRKFTDFYVAAPICSASRAALLTGSYPLRVGITGVLFPRHKVGLNPEETTIAEVFKSAGYATACIGKWHLGHHAKFLPRNHGFDSYFGIPYSNDMTVDPASPIAEGAVFRMGMTAERMRSEKPKKNWVPLFRNEEVIEYPVDQTLITKRSTEEAVKFMRANKDRPFFLYMPHTMPHIPLFASKDYLGKSKRGLYGDVIEEIDGSVGTILKTLKELELDGRTLVVFTSDNGPWLSKKKAGGSAKPLRDGKFTTYEGGMREPCIMRWPGRIPAGSECAEVASTLDLLPTFAKLAGAELDGARAIDGKDIWPLMAGTEGASSPHEIYCFYRGNALQAVRSGKWKLHLKGGRRKAVELYDLASDVSESKNVAEAHAEVVARLTGLAQAFDKKLKANRRPVGKLD